jgi:hypothetical protein
MNIKVELWELFGPCWRLPARVVWYADLAEVRVGAGAPLTERMRTVAEEKLLTVANRKGTSFWASREALGKVAVLSRYEDPQEVIEWAPLRPSTKVESTFQASDFIQGYCECSFAVIRNPLLATMIWASFCKFMMHWMLNERKTVDLVFAEMDAFMLRRNWQGVAAKAEQKLHRAGAIKDRDLFNSDAQNVADRMGFVFTNRDLTSFDEKTRTLGYTLDVRPNKKFFTFARELVIERMSGREGRSGGNYTTLIRELKGQVKRVIKAYAHYLAEATAPTSNVDCFIYDRAQGKWTWSRGGRTVGESGDPRDGGLSMQAAVEPSPAEEGAGPAETLPAPMPDLQPPDRDMRDTRIESVS